MISWQFVTSPPPLTPTNSFPGSIRRPMSSVFLSTYSSSSVRFSCSLAHQPRPLRCAILGAGFAGLSVAWHLLQNCSKELPLLIDIYDEVGIGGGASGVAGGLLHPYSPKVKPLWRSTECWNESLRLVQIAEDAGHSKVHNMEKHGVGHSMNLPVIKRRGLLLRAIHICQPSPNFEVVLQRDPETCYQFKEPERNGS